MDKHEAKLLLASYALGREPAGDPRFEAARSLAATDPELKQWWEANRIADQRIQEALARAPVPADLRAALRESLSQSRRRKPRLLRFPYALAAAAMIVLSGFLFFQYGIDRSDLYQGPLVQRAYDYSVDGPRLTYFHRDTQKLRDWLVENGFDLPEKLPPKLLEQKGIGCRPLKWSEEGVALMCFDAETVYHLFVAAKRDFPDFVASAEFDFRPRGKGWTTSEWTDGDHVFVLTAKATPAEMADYLASYTPGQ